MRVCLGNLRDQHTTLMYRSWALIAPGAWKSEKLVVVVYGLQSTVWSLQSHSLQSWSLQPGVFSLWPVVRQLVLQPTGRHSTMIIMIMPRLDFDFDFGSLLLLISSTICAAYHVKNYKELLVQGAGSQQLGPIAPHTHKMLWNLLVYFVASRSN